ncbi:metal-dependent hydrolase [Haloarcula brevis]|uniref:metal-dependent hydrolase n=1 Tax=Haloarcula brevis TaxID=3111453 RepID=UPI00300E75E5
MMLPTHALGGMTLALSVAFVAPEFTGVALVAGFLGGVFPDADLYAGHRKSLHYPVYYTAFALLALVVAGLSPSIATVAATCFLAGAAVHSVTDIFGGGLELRPWEATSDRAVYDHYRDQWIEPRRWVRYDGSPADLLVSLTLAVPLLVALGDPLRQVVLGTLTVAVVYTAVRRLLPTLAATIVDDVLAPHLPDHLLAYVPTRYREVEG